MAAITEMMKGFKVSSPLFPNDAGALVKVPDDSTFPNALKKMFSAHVMAVPIVDSHSGQLITLLTMADAIAFILSVFSREEMVTADLNNLIEKQHETSYLNVMKVPTGLSEPVVELPSNTELYEAVQMMVRNGSHRVLVYDDQQRPVNLITQSRVVKFISVLKDSIPQSNRTLQELHLGFKEVLKVDKDAIAYDAFNMMLNQKVSAVGVVDKEGRLFGSLSVNDIKELGYDLRFFEMLTSSVESYLSTLRICDAQRTLPPIKDPLTCKATDKFADVIDALVKYRVHRIYIVDDNQKPIGVVSLSDILKEIMAESSQ